MFTLNTDMERPHLVILGAGASRAAFPNGDRSGRSMPLMNDLVSAVSLEPLLQGVGIDFEGRSFEEIYAGLKGDPALSSVALELESAVREYFTGMDLPDGPTLYDHLVLSLRPKDAIATFNWDPFLFRAYVRNAHVSKPPHLLFLHGNTEVGVCTKCRVKGRTQSPCRKCGRLLEPTRLLYPIDKKDYATDPYIESEWITLKRVLENAYILTIFGYSAPVSDAEAVKLLREGWGPSGRRNLEEIEIIDIKPKQELEATWEAFIHADHYRVVRSFGESWIARHPRRTCEAMWNQLMELRPEDDNWIPWDLPWNRLWEWYRALVNSEDGDGGRGSERPMSPQ